MQNKEIVIFHVHNEDQFYILHGTQCRNLDICKFQDFCIIQKMENLIFDVHNEDKFEIWDDAKNRKSDNWKSPNFAWCKM